MEPSPYFVYIKAFILPLPKKLVYFLFLKSAVSKETSPNRRKLAQSGVDVMITIFCDFRRKNWRFSQKPML
jgi:hypothetical protein